MTSQFAPGNYRSHRVRDSAMAMILAADLRQDVSGP
jgi:hypothetical protein